MLLLPFTVQTLFSTCFAVLLEMKSNFISDIQTAAETQKQDESTSCLKDRVSRTRRWYHVLKNRIIAIHRLLVGLLLIRIDAETLMFAQFDLIEMKTSKDQGSRSNQYLNKRRTKEFADIIGITSEKQFALIFFLYWKSCSFVLPHICLPLLQKVKHAYLSKVIGDLDVHELLLSQNIRRRR